jgi:MoaA/NifB/PqqE/SkfB family radical SAM enzyme
MTRLDYSRFAKNFLKRIGSYGYLYSPLNAQIEITSRCNARCVFCSIWQKEYQKDLDQEMTTDQIKRIIDDFSRLGVMVLSFTGGEPTLRKDLPELLRYSRSKGIMNAMATNGFLLYDMIKKGQLDGVEWIMVSLDWPDAARHNKYRQLEVFDRAIKGIRAAQLERKQVLISTVITKENINYMEEMCKLARNIGVMIEMLPCEDIIRETEKMDHVVNEIESFIPDLSQYANEIRRLNRIYPNLMTDDVTAMVIEAGGFGYQKILRCVMAESYLFVRYNGEVVFPCKLHPVLKVDVTKQSLYDVYYSLEARKIMDKKDDFPFCKGCRFGCGIATSIPANLSTLYEKYIRGFFNGNMF